MGRENLQVVGLITLLFIYILLESSDIIKPKQYHVVDNNYSTINYNVPILSVGSTASGYTGPFNVTPLDRIVEN